jgi:hypothetical protein
MAYKLPKERQVTIDMTRRKMDAFLDSHSRGVDIVRICVIGPHPKNKKLKKRMFIWVSVSRFYGQPKVRVTIQRKLGHERHLTADIHPYQDIDTKTKQLIR